MFFQTVMFFNVLGLSMELTNLSVHTPTLQCQLPLACIPLKNCDSLKTLIKTSQNLESTLKFLKTQFCGSHSETEMRVCCPEVGPSHKSIKKQLNESPCRPTFRCVSLTDCGPLKRLLDKEKPATKGVVKFIKSQQCGVEDIYPKVCCKESGQSKEVDEIKISLTTERAVSATKMISTKTSLKEKSEAINKLFNVDFDDLMFHLL